jgi:hypothetical protein
VDAAAAHKIGDPELAELQGIDPDAPSDTDDEDYVVGVPILAEQARQADPAAWAWLTQVHETWADSRPTNLTHRDHPGVFVTHHLEGWLAPDLRERLGYPG